MIDKKRYPVKFGLVVLAYIAFIALGMPDGLMGVAWPSIREGFQVPLDSLGLLMVASTTGYLTSSFFSGYLLRNMGIGRLLAASCALTGLTLIGYTLVPSWWIMAALGLFAGLGAGAIDAGLNTYAAVNFPPGLMQWLHASYGVGITSGPFIMTFGLTNLHSWRFAYAVVGGFQILLAAVFLLSVKNWRSSSNSGSQQAGKNLAEYTTSYKDTFKQLDVWLSLFLFMIYVGAEMSLGAWTYTLLTQARGIDPKTAGFWAGSFYGLFATGRILAGLYARRLGNDRIILFSTMGAILGSVMLLVKSIPVISLIGVVVAGFSIAPIFAALMSGTSSRVKPRFLSNTVGMQMASSGIGGSLLSSLLGILARRISLEVIPFFFIALFVIFLIIYRVTMRRSENSKPIEISAEAT